MTNHDLGQVDPQADETHDATAQSWVASANAPDADFPLQNLPFGAFRHAGSTRIGIAIGDQVLDLSQAYAVGLFAGMEDLIPLCTAASLAPLMAQGRGAARRLRKLAFSVLKADSPQEAKARRCLVAMADIEMLLPAEIGDFTDFYTSIHHASRGGQIARPGTPQLFPNFKNLPVAYHGRASSVVATGAPCVRPWGQVGAGQDGASRMEPSGKLDFELEVGCYVGTGNRHGQPIPLGAASQHIFGVCLVNDWSARDVQRWESQPLGPFLAKSFATTVSPWVVTLDALVPFRVASADRGSDAPVLSAYLDTPEHRLNGGLDINLQVLLRSKRMRELGQDPTVITRADFAKQYWTLFQMLAHHSSNGCNLRTGDLLSSGTVSDPEQARAGCLFELTWDGATPISLPDGEQRTYLADGDEVIFRGTCSRNGYRSIGFGECRGLVMPALPQYPGHRT